MTSRLGSKAIALIVLCAVSAMAPASELALSRLMRSQLGNLRQGDSLSIKAFPVGPSQTATIAFKRVQIYSADAHVYRIGATGDQAELPRSSRIFLRGYSDDGSVRVALSLNPDFSIAEGNGIGAEGSFALKTDATGTSLHAVTLESTIPKGATLNYQCGNEFENMDVDGHAASASQNLAQQLGLAAPGSPAEPPASSLRLATIAVDSDSMFMSKLFSNNTASAGNWIAGMFNTMNIMYERDLSVQLLQGTTILRTSAASDPYTGATNVPADGTDLNIFGAYWRANESSVPRAFATLLSGRGPCTQNGQSISCSASGIAWIDEYCQKGFINGSNTVGSYSVVQVFSNLAIDSNASLAARLTGHELGHNFGAYHTHCTNTTTGAAPVATSTIDQCFNGEAGAGCYAGTASCPAAGAGTIMSYCNFTSVSHCAAGTQNLLQFHPTQITVLDNFINQQSACVGATDEIFFNGFQ